MVPNGQASSVLGGAGIVTSVRGGLHWGVDRLLATGYAVAYDYIFEEFAPYQALKREVMALVEAAVPDGVSREDVHVLDIACGPGNMAVTLAEAGFSVVGIDPYGALLEIAREKRRAHHLVHLAFRQGDLAAEPTFKAATFDQIVNVHSLYLHPRPERLLAEAYRVLKPGGTAVFVNRMRHVADWPTVRNLRARDGLRPALRSLLWVVPNAIFEALRHPAGAHYWDEGALAEALRSAGFTVLDVRRTFLDASSVLALARRDRED
jgi:ubiquinone/menaquinone biosynthesis C-methylase UbiE